MNCRPTCRRLFSRVTASLWQPYLQDFSELEWRVGEVAVEIEHDAVGMDGFAGMDSETVAGACLTLQPGVRYLCASWDVDALLTLYLTDSEPDRFGVTPGDIRIPATKVLVAARIAMVQELTVPSLLFVGLATRLATRPFLGMLAVIQTFVYPNAWAEHLVWGSILLFLLTRGPGAFSLNHVIAHVWRTRAQVADPLP